MMVDDYPVNIGEIDKLAKAAGLSYHSYDSALPQHWVDGMLELTEKMAGIKGGIYPYGFVWGYDKSPIWGEPIPLTEYAKLYAQFVGVKPR